MSKKATTRKSSTEPTLALIVNEIGTAVQVQYFDKKRRLKVHLFKTGTALHATRDGTKLIIGPVRVKDSEIH